MSFVANLPLEIVHQIFSLCIDFSKIQAWTPEFKNRRLSEYPVVLTSICHLWSGAVLSCPQLWSTLPIVIYRNPEGPHYNANGELEGIEYLPPLSEISRWIGRSGSTPLAISVRPGIKEDELDDAWFNECYGRHVQSLLDTILLPHHRRWAKFSLRMPTPLETSQDTLSALSRPSAYPALKEISFHGLYSDTDEGPVQALVHILSHSPQLSSVELQEVNVPRASIALQTALPWNQLSSVFLSKGVGKGYSAQSILHLLRDDGVPNLERLGISMHEIGEHLGSLHVRHEKLRELDLHESCPTQFLAFITHVTLPNLCVLTIPADCLVEEGSDGHADNCGTKAMPQFGTVVPTFIERSRCRLEKLHLHDDFVLPSAGPEALPILRAVRGSVEQLQIIVGSSEVETVLEWLTVRQGAAGVGEGTRSADDGVEAGAMFPRLRHLTIKIWASADAPPGKHSQAVLDMVESRWNAPRYSQSFVQTAYIDVGLRTETLGTDNADLKKKAWALIGTEDATDRLRGLAEGTQNGVVLGEVNHSKRIRITVGGIRGELQSGIFKPYFDTWLSCGVWVKP